MVFRRRAGFRLDADALAALYEAHATRMTGYFVRRLGDPATAVDLMADTFARAFAARRGFAGATEDEALGWLYGIAVNVLRRYLRDGSIEQRALQRWSIERRTLDDEDVAAAWEVASTDQLDDRLASAIARLSLEQQEAIRLRIVEELDYEDIATRLGVTETTVRARVSRGLRQLRSALQELS